MGGVASTSDDMPPDVEVQSGVAGFGSSGDDSGALDSGLEPISSSRYAWTNEGRATLGSAAGGASAWSSGNLSASTIPGGGWATASGSHSSSWRFDDFAAPQPLSVWSSSMPSEYSDPFAASQPKGARMVDAAPMRRTADDTGADGYMSNGNAASFSTSFANAAVSASPMRPSRAVLESDNASLRASVVASRAALERLLRKAESIRKKHGHGRGADQANSSLLVLHREVSTRRVQLVSSEAELKRYRERVRSAEGLSEKLRRDLDALHRDCVAAGHRAREAQRKRDEASDKLNDGQQELEDLSRKAATEQLRAAMLREAFEQEQSRVGVSLGRAEAYVGDLVEATEGTRKVEVEEQSMARECVAALDEIAGAEARDEAMAEVASRELRSELAEIEAMAERSQEADNHTSLQNVRRIASYTEAQMEEHEAAADVAGARRSHRTLVESYRRNRVALGMVLREVEELRARCEDAGFPLDGSAPAAPSSASAARLAALRPRLRYDEAEHALMLETETHLRDELSAMRLSNGNGSAVPATDLDALRCRLSAASAGVARERLHELRRDLAQARGELEAVATTPAPSAAVMQSRSSGAGLTSDLEAAGLQRRLGALLVGEQQSFCRLQEALLNLHLNQDVIAALERQRSQLLAVRDASSSAPRAH
eukprot:TRINITY_DN10498_c0_g3_i1.p1 TRINITY_DN10498_c0_g3~~TRINITY_DN10498_c0_g3_i1.p1  ORF type:complete len:677 (-),score=122.96 TRINITY_DN10498_c0_g3_i1:204-2177(-)